MYNVYLIFLVNDVSNLFILLRLSNILFFVHLVYYSMIVKSRLTNEILKLDQWMEQNETR